MLKLFIYLLCIGLSYAQILQSGQCDPNIPLENNLNIEQFSGRWYSIGATVSLIQTGDCSYLELNPINNVTSSGVNSFSVYIRSLNQNFLEEFNANATAQNSSAIFSMNFPSIGKDIDFRVMITDYDNYALAYSCENVGTTQRNLYIWQLGRTTAFITEMITNLMNTQMSLHFNLTTNDLAVIQHTEMACYELPELEPGQPVILPGLCDLNLPVVQNFSAVEFQGVWHQIASYYTPHSVGGCNRAEYTLRGSVVDVVNSEVISQTLYTISGNATISSNDTSARLLVTLEIAPNVADQRPLWILATDYLNYAVSYTCIDIGNNQKQVYSWILSRTRQLNETVQTEVNRVISSYIDLNNRYFVQANQSDAACFYYPDSVPGLPVIFRGQCDINIPVVANFSVADYLGEWHTIESYPSEYQLGTCNNAQYSLGTNGVVDVYNTEVINQTLSSIRGTAQLASSDGSAKLIVTFPIAGTNLTITTDYWVLATDYDSYALVYSCTDIINNDEKRVTAWKLSRTKQLPAAAAPVFAQAMSNIAVLDEKYFYSNDQDDSACFYFPEPQSTEPVIFRGQCDESISAVNDFNSTLFAGTWYEIQAYPKEFQPGQCINHVYSVTESGLNVISSGVNDQLLEVTSSSVAVNGTSGRLSITIPTNGSVITIPFWILGVDYQDYALAYSCMNINEDYRAVYSWKLSRSTQLSSAAVNAINRVTSDIIVLDNRYYQDISYSDDACFYFPEFSPGEPIILYGQCDPNIQAMQNLSVTEYQGRWRLIESYPSDFQTGTCNEARYTALNGSDLIEVVNSQVIDSTLVSITGTAAVSSSGVLTVTFGNSSMQLVILGTDYTTYSLAYSCENITNNTRRVWSWKLSRSRVLIDTAITNINRIIDNVLVLNNRYYEAVDQTDDGCFYFPEPGPNPVVFRGQCNESIPAIRDFNATAYLGLWHTIGSYPSLFQSGTCNNALYSPGTASDVDVYNTQVINETLDEIWGTANLSSTDNSGKLLVSFPIAGTNQSALSDYWILDTDYESYALVYTCVNIDDESRQVWSWKLSRSKSLSTSASNAINSVISSIPVLDNRYFIDNDQSAEGCFYYPEPQPGVVVEFPGQCNESIQAVPNFNLTAFQGIWYEIEAYPKEQQMGQCINHEYSLSGINNLSLTSTYVFNQLLGTSVSDVAFNSTQDTSGKLTVTIQNGNNVVSFPFWILSTDYEDYALAYSCQNINSDFRRIFSWKLSRSQNLSSSANTVINNAMTNIEVLQNRYYERIDQSDSACFYLPNITLYEPVIFNGQCDPDISVVSNFNVSRYQGRWRIISSYYDDQQIHGSCGQAEYQLRDNMVFLENSLVINEQLFSVQGNASLASNDSSAKLEVQIGNNTADLWILDTDYDSYAIAYNCRNLENNRRRVYSWILSRGTSLSNQAVNNISTIINSIDVLDNRYFRDVDQTDAACFYYPEPNPSQPVIFRGQCDQNISVVTDFNITEYMGQWFDTASYPSNFQGGTCNTAQYTLNGTQVDVLNSEVINETLATASAVGRFAGDTNVAKLLVNFGVGDSDYWVLATDYSSYALVYSCKNIDVEHRQVGVWKLSRTRQLSANASTAINNTMAGIPVIADQYFVTRDHSNIGCFYYPEPQPGDPVIFPGQCDTNIQAISNFNLTNFQGIWHEIEKYPTDHQSGQCINQEFSISSGSAFNLVSRSVNNITLFENYGTATITSTDGTGRLNINLQSANGNALIPFWVLDTNYDDYALAYGCVNVDSESRQVYSWKLSRSKTLSSVGIAAINNRISNIQVLDQRYYEDVSQSDPDCFYLPDLAPGEAVTFPGQCNQNISVISNFNVTRYAGVWRLLESYQSDFQSGACNDATYTLQDGTVLVRNSQVINQTLNTIDGTATLATLDNSGKLLVNFTNVPEAAEYWVLDTDYDSYSLVYSCVNINNDRRRVWSWKLSRSREFSSVANSNMNAIINTIDVLDSRYYQSIDHSDDACFYYPVPDGNPVVFRGQCDQNITVVSNFNIANYMGEWFDTASYPSNFQGGTCNTAQYTLNGTQVDVLNTEVINETLVTASAVGRFAGDTNVAKLLVNFGAGDSDYWVLATDYSSYALVYSCKNIDVEHRQVGSWKLSRTRQLSAVSAAAINSAIATIPVLDDRYFVTRDHSDTGCFYYPEPQPGSPVIFPGQCDMDIQPMQNFNITAFQGVWHEIQKYPTSRLSGDCLNQEFSLSSTNILDLVARNIQNQTLIENSGIASFNTTNGQLTITLQYGNESINLPFWVLDAVYDDYALIYGCENINLEQRRVYSWKLSRTKELSNTANAAINNRTNSIQVLDSRYYENVDQSDAACFYLPNLGPGEEVTFPGQCDQNISVMTNFDATRYTGRWRLLETYYTSFQRGTCIDATYSLLTNGTVLVLNSQVINQTLDTIEGTATLVSNNGTGKLLVNFPSTNQAAEYWILDTDYDSYSLVYSCRNIDENRRRVWSWKLSKMRAFTATAINSMNAIIDRINVLDSRYYQVMDQSDDACFYYPEPSGKPVVFRGQCDENINLVSNFSAGDYLNTWYDIESYPTGFQFGTCPTATYTLNGSIVDVHNTEVVNQTLSSIYGIAVPYPDGSARLNVSFPIEGTNLYTYSPYYVLATDYTNYALVYSCVNIDEDSRMVYSWKLSRNTTLSAASNTAINNVIGNIPVLHQQYYNVRGHTEEDCFFYPDNEGGPVVLEGVCDSSNLAISNFNLNSFAGEWYEVSRFPSELPSGECVANNFTTLASSNTFNLIKTFVSSENLIVASGTATAASDGRGALSVSLTDNTGAGYNITMYLLDVDYSDYALLYGCRDLGNDSKQIYSWALSRNQQGLSSQAVANINRVVSETRDLSDRYFVETGQTLDACFHYPEFDVLPDQITLLGPCDESIQGISNFNAAAYLGKWYQIASYPQAFQFGDCSRAYYSTEDGVVVNVMNTQVTNRTLDVAYATAVVASNDGTGVLNVTFTFPGFSTVSNYYILATDYTDYALVYSCRNLDAGNERQVTSWKLSRNKTLSSQAEEIMNRVINETQGLRETYYVPSNQSDEACFYIPEVNRDQAPLFRGQCEDIEGVQGFNAQRYVGWWHEIERYPTDANPGSCISLDFRASGNAYQIVETSVRNNNATVVTSNVAVSSNGRLRKTYSDGRIVDIWVLATDYESYSLLYSCENVNADYKRVWSAKHSKTRELTQLAQNAMSEVITRVEVLEPQFYLPVDQSDGTCFHYPELTGDQVILPGQCDANIPVTMQFQPAEYTGTWYQIQRYPQRYENGNCTGARYSLNTETGEVSVLNWEVVNGELDTIEGNAFVTSLDGSARLIVNLPIRGPNVTEQQMVSMDLYILTTDYLSYSLAYSCVNVGPYRRAVSTWKLSRTRTMTAAGNVAINTYMASREEFNDAYFITVDQSDECPEPSSAILAKSSIIVLLISIFIISLS